MGNYAIIHIETDHAASNDSILRHFNEYMQEKRPHTQAFVTDGAGYFRMECERALLPSSAAIEAFGNFLVSSGYSISAISSAKTHDGEEGTRMKFTGKDGIEESVVLSTLNAY